MRNPNWYNSHSTRRYPLDDNATGTDDAGTRIQDNILVDCRLHWPEELGQYAFVTGITVSEFAVSVVFAAAASPTATTGFNSIAAVTVTSPVERHVMHNIRPLAAGVGGFVAFGEVREAFVGRFSTPAQSLLAPRCCQPYAALPIPNIRKAGRDIGLVDLVSILAGTDLEIIAEELIVDGDVVTAMVLRLAQVVDDSTNVLAKYIGPCGQRPESGTCNKDGIEALNDVTPDCDGNIRLVFTGLLAGEFESCGSEGAGTTLDQTVGLDEVCAALNVPERFLGEDSCSSESEYLPEEVSLSSEALPEASLSSESCGSLPYTDYFDPTAAADWLVDNGSFAIATIDSPDEPVGGSGDFSYASTSLSQRNVAVFQDCVVPDTIDKTVRTHVLLTDPAGAFKHNGGLVLNFHEVSGPSRDEYYIAEIDRNAHKVRLRRYTGSNWITEHEVSPTSPFVLGHWYEIEASVVTASGEPNIEITVTGITAPAWSSVNFSIQALNYLPADGYFGIASDRAQTSFSFFTVEDV